MNFTIEENRIYLQGNDKNVIAEVTFPYIDSSTVEINHTFVDESLRGQGVAGKLLLALVGQLKERNLKAVLTCSYAVTWFEKHPEYKDLLKQ